MSDNARQFDLLAEMEVSGATSGIAPAQRIKSAIELRKIKATNPIAEDQVQPASLDLRLGRVAYEIDASFLPGPRNRVEDKLSARTMQKISLDQGTVLRRDHIYLVKLQEAVSFKARDRISALANPKSSTGRLDVFARLITDYSDRFDTVPPGYTGPLWLEIVPRSFNVEVRTGSRLAQLRLVQGSPRSSNSAVKRLLDSDGFVWGESAETITIRRGTIGLSVDLHGDTDTEIIGYKAIRTDQEINVDVREEYQIADFWEPIYRPDKSEMVLELDEFYILASQESIALPNDVAGDMVAYDTLMGEFRVHYAGFFDPGFGYIDQHPVGAKIVLEIRSHEVNFLIEHGQAVGGVALQRLLEDTERPYGNKIGSSYQRQGLSLSKHFRRGG